MGGQYSVDQILKILVLVCEAANVVEQLVVKKKLIAVFSLSDELLALATLNFDLFKKQLGELDGDDYDKLHAGLKAKLDLEDDKVELVIEEGADLVQDYVALAAKTVTFVKKVKGE